MSSDPNIPPANDQTQSDSRPPLLPPESKRPSGSLRQFLAVLLSVCLALYLLDAVVSLVDDSLILFFGLHVFSVIRALVGIFAVLMVILVYGLMGLTPMIPKRLFLPLPLSNLV